MAHAGEAAAATSTASLAKQAAEMRALSPVKVTPSDSSSARLRRTLGVSSPYPHVPQQSGNAGQAYEIQRVMQSRDRRGLLPCGWEGREAL